MKTRKGVSRRLAAVVVSLTAVVLTSCAQSITALSPPTAQASEEAVYVLEHLRERQEPIRPVYYDKFLVERLPNTLFSVDGQKAERLGEGVVVGEVVEIAGGRGYVADEADVGGTEVPFDSTEAQWRTITVTISVSERWGYKGDRASFGFSIDGGVDRDRMMRGVRDLGRVIVALGPQVSLGRTSLCTAWRGTVL